MLCRREENASPPVCKKTAAPALGGDAMQRTEKPAPEPDTKPEALCTALGACIDTARHRRHASGVGAASIWSGQETNKAFESRFRRGNAPSPLSGSLWEAPRTARERGDYSRSCAPHQRSADLRLDPRGRTLGSASARRRNSYASSSNGSNFGRNQICAMRVGTTALPITAVSRMVY
jgi:hypothetical protein